MNKVFLTVFMTLLCLKAFAQPAPLTAVYTESRDSEFYTFYYDKAVSADGERSYRIVTAVPKKQPKEGGYPSVYATDGNAVLEMITEEQLRELSMGEPPVIVAIGYETDKLFHMPARTYDYTPARSDGRDAVDELDTSRMGGGASVYLDFIKDKVFSLSEKRAPLNRERRTLFGHSYGGLFVLTVIKEHPELFRSYISADPSFWWQRGDYFWSFMQTIPEADLIGRHILLMKGALANAYLPSEGDSEKIRKRKMLYAHSPKDALRRAAERLFLTPGAFCEYRELGYLSHGPLFPAALKAALRASVENK
jgi:predicted alpha/beta superfamily hydrolase